VIPPVGMHRVLFRHPFGWWWGGGGVLPPSFCTKDAQLQVLFPALPRRRWFPPRFLVASFLLFRNASWWDSCPKGSPEKYFSFSRTFFTQKICSDAEIFFKQGVVCQSRWCLPFPVWLVSPVLKDLLSCTFDPKFSRTWGASAWLIFSSSTNAG